MCLSDRVVLSSTFSVGNSNFLRSRSIFSMCFSKGSSELNEGTKHGFDWRWSTLCLLFTCMESIFRICNRAELACLALSKLGLTAVEGSLVAAVLYASPIFFCPGTIPPFLA